MQEDILFAQAGSLGLITLNRPKALNALTYSMIKSIFHQLLLWQSDDDIQAVVIDAAPGKAFCAGGDIRWLYDNRKENHAQQMEFFWHEYRLNYFIHQFQKPYIALMNGMAMGGGVGISLHGRYTVATENFSFAMPETAIGFFPDIGASYLLSRCPGEYGTYLALTGGRLSAREACALGLVKCHVESHHLPNIIKELKEKTLSVNSDQFIEQYFERIRMDNPAPEKEFEQTQHWVNVAFTYDTVEEIIEHLASSNYEWHQQTLQSLLTKSPLSLKVTLEQMRRAKQSTLEECLQMDYQLVGRFMQDYDFYEGVRALIVDKDKKPIWHPANLSSVTKNHVLQYFQTSSIQLDLK